MNICLFSHLAKMVKLSPLVFQGRVEGCVPGGWRMRAVHTEVTDVLREAFALSPLTFCYGAIQRAEEL